MKSLVEHLTESTVNEARVTANDETLWTPTATLRTTIPFLSTPAKALRKKIVKRMNEQGSDCDLNDLDISKVTDMSYLFFGLDFNGDISKWDVSHVTNMDSMFIRSKFNGDISKWDVSRVENMSAMFAHSKFNKDISKWDVSSVKDMSFMFLDSPFKGDILLA